MKSLLLTLPILLMSYQVAVAEPMIQKYDTEEALQFLIACESDGLKWAVNNDEPHGSSYGVLQMRLETFERQGKKYGLPHNDIFSEEQQKAIARKMIEDELAEKHWVVCWKLYINYLK